MFKFSNFKIIFSPKNRKYFLHSSRDISKLIKYSSNLYIDKYG